MLLSVLMISAGIAQVAPSTTSFVQASSSAGELFATIDRKPKFDGSNDAGKKLERFTGDIEFRNVSFAYPSRPHISVLKGVSFDAPANKTTALVGASGSGKSTIVALMERWYELGVSKLRSWQHVGRDSVWGSDIIHSSCSSHFRPNAYHDL